ncbi:MAG: hypothetical protein P8L44_07785, partial [Opitutales bacterium]|nr:hypothetical protein [Opitutales bacterium]
AMLYEVFEFTEALERHADGILTSSPSSILIMATLKKAPSIRASIRADGNFARTRCRCGDAGRGFVRSAPPRKTKDSSCVGLSFYCNRPRSLRPCAWSRSHCHHTEPVKAT